MRYVGERQIVIDENPTPVEFWDFEREKLGGRVIVLGGGPSHVEVDINLLVNIPLLAINSSCRKVEKIAKREDILYFSDNSWAEHYERLVRFWPGRVVSSNRNSKIRLGNLINYLDISRLTEIMQVRSDFVQASSGHSAVCLAACMGVRRIVLIGFEGKMVNGRTHGHDDYQMQDLSSFEERFLPGWRGLASKFKEMNIEIINSTPDSEIKEFKFLPLGEALA